MDWELINARKTVIIQMVATAAAAMLDIACNGMEKRAQVSHYATGCFKSSFRLKIAFCLKHLMYF